MDKERIGTNAGIVWGVLSSNARCCYEDLKKASGLNDRDLNMAIGWLAREDKIEFEKDSSNDIFYINSNYYF